MSRPHISHNMGHQALPSNYDYECGLASCAPSSTSPVKPTASNRRRSVLGDLNVHASVNARIESSLAPAATPLDKRIASGGRSENELTPESLAEDLEHFHLHSPERIANHSQKCLLSDKDIGNLPTPRKRSESQLSGASHSLCVLCLFAQLSQMTNIAIRSRRPSSATIRIFNTRYQLEHSARNRQARSKGF